jgi:hypothetical protein
MPPASVRLVLTVDLCHHADRDGGLTGDAEDVVFCTLGSLPAGAMVRLDLGAARWCSVRLLGMLREYLAHAGGVEICGSEPAALEACHRAIAGRLAAS